MAAAGMLGQVAAGGRGGDMELAAQQAQLNQQAGLAGYQGDISQGQFNAQLGQQGNMFNAQQTQAAQLQFQQLQAEYAKMGMSAQQANQAAAMQVQQMQMGANQFNASQDLAAAQGAQQMAGQLIGATGAGVAAYAGATGKNKSPTG
jgi:hypothetical protein